MFKGVNYCRTMTSRDSDTPSEQQNGVQGTVNGESTNNEEAERKLTQTDHLNKTLLDSFLQRLNQNNTDVPSMERINTDTVAADDGFQDRSSS